MIRIEFDSASDFNEFMSVILNPPVYKEVKSTELKGTIKLQDFDAVSGIIPC